MQAQLAELLAAFHCAADDDSPCIAPYGGAFGSSPSSCGEAFDEDGEEDNREAEDRPGGTLDLMLRL